MKIIPFLNRIIEFSFYALFFLVPLIFSSSTSELFELPKMFLTFTLTIFIISAWLSKMIILRRIQIQRTPIDIPIILFLISQIISTIFSLDPHVSFWGYYSRFNGGLLSIVSYVLLYYAFVSNLNTKHALKLLSVSLFSGLIVALWGFPSHFGIDPTCYVLRGTFDTTCWTEAFRPTIRIFSTLGQPAWLTAYLSIIIPISIAYFLIGSSRINQIVNKYTKASNKLNGNKNPVILYALYFILSVLLYVDLLFTNTRGGFIGFWIANLIFWIVLFLKKVFERRKFIRYFLLFNLTFIIMNFFIGVPISQISQFTLPEIVKNTSSTLTNNAPNPTVASAGAFGGTDSGKIRLLVWRGAIDAWKDNMLIGTGVETFAYAYYKYKPVAHNLTSEWDYLYNKAHNEYLNYLATTGIFGLGSYLAIIGVFLFKSLKYLNSNISSQKTLPAGRQGLKTQHNGIIRSSENLNIRSSGLLIIPSVLIIGLVAGYISILISNFFGFSVVIINLYFFLIPAFVFLLGGMLNPDKTISKTFGSSDSFVSSKTSIRQKALLGALILTSSFSLLYIFNYVRADISYAKGSNLNKAGSTQEAYRDLVDAVNTKSVEPVYRDELSINLATLASAFYLQKEATTAATLTSDAITLNDELVLSHPNNIVFWKNRVRLFYTLAQGDPDNENLYLGKALDSLNNAQVLAPKDAKITYNLGVLYGQINDFKKGISLLEKAIKLKPDYRDAYFALGLFYEEIGERAKAVKTYEYILKNIDPEDGQVKESLKSWE